MFKTFAREPYFAERRLRAKEGKGVPSGHTADWWEGNRKTRKCRDTGLQREWATELEVRQRGTERKTQIEAEFKREEERNRRGGGESKCDTDREAEGKGERLRETGRWWIQDRLCEVPLSSRCRGDGVMGQWHASSCLWIELQRASGVERTIRGKAAGMEWGGLGWWGEGEGLSTAESFHGLCVSVSHRGSRQADWDPPLQPIRSHQPAALPDGCPTRSLPLSLIYCSKIWGQEESLLASSGGSFHLNPGLGLSHCHWAGGTVGGPTLICTRAAF